MLSIANIFDSSTFPRRARVRTLGEDLENATPKMPFLETRHYGADVRNTVLFGPAVFYKADCRTGIYKSESSAVQNVFMVR